MANINIEDLLQGRQPANIEELQQMLNEGMQRLNNRPEAHFCGLSPFQMHTLLHDPFSPESTLGWRDFDPQVLDQCPFFRLAEAVLRLTVGVQNPFTLTAATGALPIKTVKNLYELKVMLDEYVESGYQKVYKQTDWNALDVCKIVLEQTGVVRKTKGKWHLTKKGQSLILPAQRAALFRLIFETFALRYNWGYLDGHEHPSAGQMGFAFSLALVSHFGDAPQSDLFYGTKYSEAFPMLADNFPEVTSLPENTIIVAFCTCFVMRFTDWFGFTKYTGKEPSFGSKRTIQKTALLDALFTMPAMQDTQGAA